MTTDITSTHTYTGTPDPQLTTWLTDTPHHWETVQDSEQLVIDTPEGEIHPRPESWLIRWNDGEVTVASPRITHRVYGPHGLASRLDQAQDAITRVRETAAQLMRAALNTAGEPLTPRDQGIDTAVRRILAALDQTTETP